MGNDRPVSFAAADVVELRRYTVHPGGFEKLTRLFDDHLIAGQHDAGMLIGTVYEDLADPDRFVWWRAFTDMPDRQRALEAFYGGPVWAAHRTEANSAMIDSDDVRLLRHTDPPRTRAVASAAATATMIIEDAGRSFVEEWHDGVLPGLLEQLLEVPVSTWRTEPSVNTFPRLPVRAGTVFVWTAGFDSHAQLDAAVDRLSADPDWTSRLRTHAGHVELMRLRPVTSGD
ncbi:putative quinol monooxygenase [Pseudonocardia sp. TRM90224]|uniref:putative quinol monooxygenase n=1 Tax=Pseudonocardia sp. TRM90224 TaxID=2812678 RepID=UPI001E32F992|nr:NIPSNAP family protein [Pseudonocardia sp. TRM90224]